MDLSRKFRLLNGTTEKFLLFIRRMQVLGES